MKHTDMIHDIIQFSTLCTVQFTLFIFFCQSCPSPLVFHSFFNFFLIKLVRKCFHCEEAAMFDLISLIRSPINQSNKRKQLTKADKIAYQYRYFSSLPFTWRHGAIRQTLKTACVLLGNSQVRNMEQKVLFFFIYLAKLSLINHKYGIDNISVSIWFG